MRPYVAEWYQFDIQINSLPIIRRAGPVVGDELRKLQSESIRTTGPGIIDGSIRQHRDAVFARKLLPGSYRL